MEEPLDDTALSRDGSRYRSSPRDRLIISLSLVAELLSGFCLAVESRSPDVRRAIRATVALL